MFVQPYPNLDLLTKNHIISRTSQGHSLYQVCTIWDHLFLCYRADRHTQTDADAIHLLYSCDYVGVSIKQRNSHRHT